MLKILKSLLIISILAGIAFGVTNAYFSDTETSRGNTLVAGSIDLKIDHVFASYNGEECEETCDPVGDNLVANSGFETPLVTHAKEWDIFPDGTTGLDWSVEWVEGQPINYQNTPRPEPANLELHAGVQDWSPQEGDQYAELDTDWPGPDGNLNGEPALVRISQTIATTPGTKYEVKFYFSPRPATSESQNELNIYWGDTLKNTLSADGSGETNTSWQEHTYQFTAASNATKIAFEAGGTPDSLGVFIDNISVREMECQLNLAGGQCHFWDEKDLSGEDIFFNLDDIKPGDYGVNVISTHVYDNDAYACMIFDSHDEENGLLEAEEEAGDTTPDTGELSNYVSVFLWHDGDQDGQFEPGDGETQISSIPDLNSPLAIAEPPDFLTASETNWLGMAWCVGNQDVDFDTGEITCSGAGENSDAQTDTLQTDISFYAEQKRHNGEFSCQNIEI